MMFINILKLEKGNQRHEKKISEIDFLKNGMKV